MRPRRRGHQATMRRWSVKKSESMAFGGEAVETASVLRHAAPA